MPERHVGWAWAVWAVVLAGGCGHPASTQRPSTGAEAGVRVYYAALARRDWQGAYDALDADSRARCGREPFDALAENYRSRLGFEPDQVRVRSCEEHGADAVAHVVLSGKVGTAERSFKNAVTLRRSGLGWGVVLPPGFGRVH